MPFPDLRFKQKLQVKVEEEQRQKESPSHL